MVASKGVNQDDMFRTFNMGIGFCLVVDPAGVDSVLQATAEHDPVVIGNVTSGGGLEIQ
jgi:phosphoribosylaminoimidazole (AIR) synthetase